MAYFRLKIITDNYVYEFLFEKGTRSSFYNFLDDDLEIRIVMR